MRGGKQTVIGPQASQSVASRLLYKPDPGRLLCGNGSIVNAGLSPDNFSKNCSRRINGHLFDNGAVPKAQVHRQELIRRYLVGWDSQSHVPVISISVGLSNLNSN
jgi:hypothetical protein